MPALPTPEIPPPETPDGHAPKPRVGPVREQPRQPTGSPVSATVRLCLVDPAADADEIVTAAVAMITTTYTAPGDRIMLTKPAAPATGSIRTRRDRLVESILRLGRGATTCPYSRPPGDHGSAADGTLPAGSKSGSGLEPPPGNETEPVANPTGQQPLGEPSGPGSDGFALIIASWSDHPADPFAMADWTPALAPAGTVAALTHSSDQHRSRAAHTGKLSRAAAMAGLILTDRLILAHQPPSRPRPASRRIHTTASVFRRSTVPPEDRHA